MLAELHVRSLGVIADLDVVLSSGLTVLTGETGAGKTLVVEALELLLGGHGDATMVRAGAEEAFVEGRFVTGEHDEVVLARALPRSGRSRAFVDARMAPLAALEEHGQELVDLYGQHAHQSLLRPAHQRGALDRFAGVDLAPLQERRRALQRATAALEALGGDATARRRELDLLAFELDEIDKAAIAGGDEDELLEKEEEELANATALREAATRAHDLLAGQLAPGALDLVGDALEALGRDAVFEQEATTLRSLQAEIGDIAASLRLAAERFEEDPERLEAVRARRQLLHRLIRKHGERLEDVLDAAARATERIAELEATDENRARLEADLSRLQGEVAELEQAIGNQRRAKAPKLAKAVEGHLRSLALERARIEIVLGETGLGDDVAILLGANAGEPAAPLAKIASGGELARAMLALRLVLSLGPPTLVFDEVDAGIGGSTALAVGAALAALARERQVLVVTHLAQVAARADHHLVVEKDEAEGRTVSRVSEVTGAHRVAELSRMLAGNPDSEAGRRHAKELLAEAAASRDR